MLYNSYDVTFSEVPDQVSLTISIAGCENKCEGCHSPHLREQNGIELTKQTLKSIVDKYKDLVTTICFLGGDQFHELYGLLRFLEIEYPNLKRALYSGNEGIDSEYLNVLDYVKVGSYNKTKGPLTSPTTNQKMYRKTDLGLFEDITYLFHNKK